MAAWSKDVEAESGSGRAVVMENRYDLIIIGGGPAGLSAAIYMARAQYKTLLIEREKIGGQITITSEVVNYPGILETDGTKLTEIMYQQAEQFGAEFFSANVTSVTLDGHMKRVVTDQGEFETIGILFATGASPRMAGFKGEAEFRGHGVAYCATCDGEFFNGKDIFVIGGGFAAAEEALFLTKYGKSVTICIRRDRFSCAKSVADKVSAHPKIKVLFHTEIVEAGGDTVLRYAVLKNNQTGEMTRYESPDGDTFGIFVFTGYNPQTELFRNQLALTDNGYLITDRTQKTNMDGVYGAGDVCDKVLRQVVTAVSDGAIAAVSLEKYAAEMHEKYQIPAFQMRTKEDMIPQKSVESANTFLTSEIRAQLVKLFGGLKRKLILRVYADGSGLSTEMIQFTREICSISEMLALEITDAKRDIGGMEQNPRIAFCAENGESLGFSFYGVPGGHELNSFVISIYNAVGKGQEISSETLEKVKSLEEAHITIAVTLSCTMCPPTVMAAGWIALHHPKITTDIIDVNRYPEIREKYHIMSVPCIIVNGNPVSFGKKTVDELLQLI